MSVDPGRLVAGGAALAAVVLLGVVGVRLVTSDSGPRSGDAAGAVGSEDDPAAGAARVAFPEAAPDVPGPEARLRPVGVRSRDIGFEEAVVAVTDRPSCTAHDGASGRVAWFDAVAPGEHGAALLLATADATVDGAPFRGLEDISVGASVEVARSNATVLTWRVIAVERVAAGTGLPIDLLAPAEEQRLVLVGCGAHLDGASVDVHVLALRAG